MDNKNVFVVALSTLTTSSQKSYYYYDKDNEEKKGHTYECYGYYQLSPIPHLLKDYLKIDLTDVILISTKKTYEKNIEANEDLLEVLTEVQNSYKDNQDNKNVIAELKEWLKEWQKEKKCISIEDYYKKFLELLFRNVSFKVIYNFDKAGDGQDKRLSVVLDEVLRAIKDEYKDFMSDQKHSTDQWHLYFDNHGGPRDIFLTIGPAVRMLSAAEDQPIKTNAIFTVFFDRSENIGIISNQTAFYNTDSDETLKQFLTYGQYIAMDFSPYEGKDPYCFISFRHDEDYINYVRTFFGALTELGIKFWFDYDTADSEKHEQEIINKIENCTIFIPLLSESYFASSYCRNELKTAAKNNCDFYPVQLSKDLNIKDQILHINDRIEQDKKDAITSENTWDESLIDNVMKKLNQDYQNLALYQYMDSNRDLAHSTPEELKNKLAGSLLPK